MKTDAKDPGKGSNCFQFLGLQQWIGLGAYSNDWICETPQNPRLQDFLSNKIALQHRVCYFRDLADGYLPSSVHIDKVDEQSLQYTCNQWKKTRDMRSVE